MSLRLLISSCLLLLAFTFTSCIQKEYVIVIPVESAELCEPDRGEEQDVVKRARGHAYNSMESHCI